MTGPRPGALDASGAARNSPKQAFAPALMNAVRDRFAHTDHCPITGQPRIFFESGGGSLKLKAAVERSAEIALLPDQEGRDNDASRFLTGIIERGRQDLMLYFGATAGQAISGETGTELLHRFIRAVALVAPPGPILSSTLEHPASQDAARYWAQATGRRSHDIHFDARVGTVTPDDYARAVTPDTRIATVIHTSQLTGFQVDLPGIVRTIRAVAPDCYIIVDGIQSAPHGPLHVDDYDCDAYVISAYKAFSRLSTGFAWLSPRLSSLRHDHMRGKPHTYWEFGSRDPGIFAAHSAVIDYLCWLGDHFSEKEDRRSRLLAGAAAMADHERALLHLLLFGDETVAGVGDIAGVSLIGPLQMPDRQGIVSLRLDGFESTILVREMAALGIRVHARINDGYSRHILQELGMRDCLRITFCHYNTPAEIRAFLEALAAIAAP